MRSQCVVMYNESRTILFFDGVCNLCNGFIDFLVTRDRDRKLLYAPLQGEAAKRLVPEHTEELKSVVLYKEGRVHVESDAALLTLAELGGVWKLCKIFFVFPAFLRNFVYRLIAKNRYKLFGQKDTCRLPTPEERTLFLD
ncbi:MAG: DCC1-like thiol-disulfide oxidoreductase family protein [Pseudomonadota bacterium]